MKIKFLNAKFWYSKNTNQFTLGGINVYRGKKAAYTVDVVKKAALDPNREFKSEKYSIFPYVNGNILNIWCKGNNGDTHLLRRNLDIDIAEKIIEQSEAAFASYKK